jgi:hypothetical protein
MSNDTRLRKARSLAKQADRLARLATEVEHLEDAAARQIVALQDSAQILDLIAPDKQPKTTTTTSTPLPALLIINSSLGPSMTACSMSMSWWICWPGTGSRPRCM